MYKFEAPDHALSAGKRIHSDGAKRVSITAANETAACRSNILETAIADFNL